MAKTYTKRILILHTGIKVEHILTVRGGNEAWDETTYLVENGSNIRYWVQKSEVAGERRETVTVK